MRDKPEGASGPSTRCPARRWPCNTLGNHDSSRVYTRYAATRVHDAELRPPAPGADADPERHAIPLQRRGNRHDRPDITDPAKLRDTMATWYYDALVNELKIDPAEAAAARRAR